MARKLAPVGAADARGRSRRIFGAAARPSGSKLPRHRYSACPELTGIRQGAPQVPQEPACRRSGPKDRRHWLSRAAGSDP
ncbi:hypothetical protein C5U62_22460 [Pseudomonas protegens]|uniref:Uncharacterized protein n=1 Tax=Pseudomonas protegens TaxID=380021 RepID=A0A2T6GGV4_9PSED|nr:hypothetical protein C5U62_22460 [Pseudomonas protegens]RXU68086.1 hypothetical protein CW358_08395 [Pseudomonas protegens]